MQPIEPETSVKVFISYTHTDQELRKKLEEHLSSLLYSGEITIWQDQEIPAGANWEDQINTHLSSADLILLLVSASFIASKYCWNKEVQAALQRHKRGEARIIPIILKPTVWQNTPLGQLQALPTGAKPVTQWNDQDAALEDVVQGLQKVVAEITLRKKALREEKIRELTNKIEAELQPAFTNLNKSIGSIHEKIIEQEKRKRELVSELATINSSLEVLKSQQDIAEDEQFQVREQLKEASEQLINLGGKLDPLTSLLLAPPLRLWLSLYPSSALRREASNLDFAKGTQYWSLTGDAPRDYIYGIDSILTLYGKACAYLKARVDQPAGFGTLAQAFQGIEYRGKRLRLSGLIKAQDVEQWAGLWMRIDGDGGNHLRFDNMSKRAISGTTHAKRYEIVLDVPAESVGIYFGVLLTGKGQVWLSDVRLEVVDVAVPTTDRF
jgi:TIR domain